MAKTLTISMPEHQWNFLQDHKDMSPSDIFQTALINMMEQSKITEKDLIQLRAKADRLQFNLQNATAFIEKQGLWEKFISETDWIIR